MWGDCEKGYEEKKLLCANVALGPERQKWILIIYLESEDPTKG